MEILVPRVNANDNDATLIAWHVEPWQSVSPGDLICSIETTKASVDVEAEAAGFVYPAVETGERLDVGEVLAWILPERSEQLLESLRAANQPTESADVLVSAKARELMDRHGIGLDRFAGKSMVSASDVEAVLQESEAGDDPARLDAVDIGDDAILLWGAGYQGMVVLDILAEAGTLRAAAIIDRDPAKREMMGVPVFRPDQAAALHARGLSKAHVCIGAAVDKIEVADALTRIGYSLVTLIHHSAVVSPSATLGEGVFVGPQVLIGMEARIGDLCQLNNAAGIAHHSELERAVQLSDGARIGGIVRIGEGTLVGIGTVVNSRVTIGARSTLVSGATIFDDVESDTVVRADGSKMRLARSG